MMDINRERESMRVAIDECVGEVLIGGLGLGRIVEELAKKPEVTRIIVVEKAQEVIDLVWPYIDTKRKGSIVCADVFEYLKTTSEQFDFIYSDIHKSASKEEYEQVAIPLRRLAEKVVQPEKVLIWRENEMRQKYE